MSYFFLNFKCLCQPPRLVRSAFPCGFELPTYPPVACWGELFIFSKCFFNHPNGYPSILGYFGQYLIVSWVKSILFLNVILTDILIQLSLDSIWVLLHWSHKKRGYNMQTAMKSKGLLVRYKFHPTCCMLYWEWRRSIATETIWVAFPLSAWSNNFEPSLLLPQLLDSGSAKEENPTWYFCDTIP